MRRILYIGLFFLWSVCVMAQTTLTHTVEFNRNDFSIVQDLHGDIITSSKHILHYSEDTSLPAIPYVLINILLPEMQKLKDFSYSASPINFTDENVNLAPNSPIVLSDESNMNSLNNSYPVKEYMLDVKYLGENIVDNYRYVTFQVSPITYNAASKLIQWHSSVDISVETEAVATLEQEQININRNTKATESLLQSIVCNFENMYNTSEISTYPTARSASNNVTYLIITADSLAEYFQPLADWKTTKGLRTEIITVENIYEEYSGTKNQLKIKQCIKEYYNNGLKYVLLGGDETIVPAQGCYGSCTYYNNGIQSLEEDMTIPTDLFYASLEGQLDWNADGDNLIGETTDNVNYISNISIGRLSINRKVQATSVINKILGYEKNPPQNNKMLLCGVELFNTNDIGSDAQRKGENWFESFINEAYCTKYRFYDTATDFEGGDSYQVNLANFQAQLNQSYHYIHMFTHGYDYYCNLENGGSLWADDAYSLQNPSYTILATIACLTNAFDNQDVCLGEGFIRGPNNGIVAYLGASREGLISASAATLGPSENYNGYFYQNLINFNNKLGDALSKAKNTMAGFCSSSNSNRWIHYALNLLGDPELPVYSNTPQEITGITLSIKGDTLTIFTEVPECTVALTSKSDNGISLFLLPDNSERQKHEFYNISESILEQCRMCITARNYKPLLIEDLIGTYIQNITYTGSNNISGKNIIIGRDVTPLKAEGDVIIESGSTTFDATNSVTIKNGFECKKGATLNIQ